MTCPICSFATGHYVCSQAPVVSRVEELEKKNKALLEVMERIEFQRGPLHTGLVLSKHQGALEYFKKTIDLLRKAIAQGEEKP